MAILVPEQTPGQPRAGRARRVRGARRGDRWRRIRRIALGASILCLLPATVSLVDAMSRASNTSFSIRAVEWLRDHGARGVVNEVESIYYSLTAPSKGGPTLRSLPQQPNAALAGAPPAPRVQPRYQPAPIPAVIRPALPGEGLWRSTRAHAGTHPPVLVTSFRSDPAYPRLVAGVAWIDHSQTTTSLYPGQQEPSVSLPRRPGDVPRGLRGRLVATFNSGFKLQDSGGGFALGGHTYAPLKRGTATLLRYQSGRLNVETWTNGPDAGPHVLFARQNLPLIVDHGRPNPNLGDGPEWGATLGNAVRVWRSGVGIDRHHNLIYAAANDQTVGSLAAILIRAGAVRAMELDINSEWVSFITYRAPGAVDPANLLAAMTRPAGRYLTPDDRDFFAVFQR